MPSFSSTLWDTDGIFQDACLDLEPGMEPMAGYLLVGRLGRGGTGEVWKAVGPGDFAVALKFTRLGRKDESDQLHSLELMRQVRHANLLALFGAWQACGFLVVGMELADRTLMDRLHEATGSGEAGIPLPELIEAMRQAARGIDHLNRACHTLSGREGVEIVHGDIKPQNLLLVGDGVKVGDFGLVKSLDVEASASGSDTSCMTLVYASPEVIRGQSSNRSDQYSLAVTYCQLRSGRLPFEGGPLAIMEGHLGRSPDLTHLPAGERPVLARALAKRPEDRWPDCGTFIDQLAGCEGVQDLPPKSRPESFDLDSTPTIRLVRPARRGAVAVAWGLPALAALLLVAAIARPIGPASRPAAGLPAPAVVRPDPALAPPAGPIEPAIAPEDASIVAASDPSVNLEAKRAEALATLRAFGPPIRQAFARTAALLVEARNPRPGAVENRPAEPQPAALADRDVPPASAKPADDPRPVAAAESAVRPAPVSPGPPVPATATISVIMPGAKAELAVRGEVGRGNPDEWYGPRRVIHTPPLGDRKDYLIGAFWLDKQGRPQTRSKEGQVEPGHSYEVDLRPAVPTWKQVDREAP